MKLIHFESGSAPTLGALLASDRVLDLAALRREMPEASAVPPSMEELLAPECLSKVAELVQKIAGDDRLFLELQRLGILRPLDGVRLLPPVLRPGLILSSGGAYRDHLKEMAVQAPPLPAGFIKCVASVTGPNDPIVLPRNASEMVDWEGEFACVIGKPCHQVAVDEAMDFVAGYTLINDVSARDWVKPFLSATGSPMEVAHRALDNLMGKQFPTFCPIGPCIVTKDELADPGRLTLTTRVNGQVMQHANTADLIHSLAETVSHFSRWYQFLPGDIITTGTPSGVGYAQVPQRFLRPGDVVEVHVEEIGALRNPVVTHGGHAH